MTAIASAAPSFDMGRVVKRTFGAIGRNWLAFGLLALALSGIPHLILGAAEKQLVFNGGTLDSAAMTTAALTSFTGALVTFVGMFVLQAAIVHGVIRDLNGQKASFGDCFSTGLRFFLPVLAISLLFGIALVFGFLLLVIPGVLMALAWCLAVPAEVVEGAGVFGAFSRSADLTRNHRGSIFGLWIAYLVLGWIISVTVFSVTGGFQSIATLNLTKMQVASWPSVALSALLQSAELLISSSGVASIYYELRSIKEGVGPEALAAVFD